MKRIQRLSVLGLCTVLIAVAPVYVAGHGRESRHRGPQFSGWSPPVNLGAVVNSTGGDFFSTISKDALSLYFTSSRALPGAQGGWDIYVSQRASVDDPWGPPQNLGPTINTSSDEGAPSLSTDGHRMYFSSNRPGGFGGNDIYVSRRHNKSDDFGWRAPENIGDDVNTSANEASPAIFEDQITGRKILYFDSNRLDGLGPYADDVGHNGNDIYSSILRFDDTFAPAHMVAELSTASADRQPVIRRDGLEIFFASDRPGDGAVGALDLWVSTRERPWDPWGAPVNLQTQALDPLSVINSPVNDAGPALSFDAKTLYFQSTRPGGFGTYDLYVMTRTKLKEHGEDHDRDSRDPAQRR